MPLPLIQHWKPIAVAFAEAEARQRLGPNGKFFFSRSLLEDTDPSIMACTLYSTTKLFDIISKSISTKQLKPPGGPYRQWQMRLHCAATASSTDSGPTMTPSSAPHPLLRRQSIGRGAQRLRLVPSASITQTSSARDQHQAEAFRRPIEEENFAMAADLLCTRCFV